MRMLLFLEFLIVESQYQHYKYPYWWRDSRVNRPNGTQCVIDSNCGVGIRCDKGFCACHFKGPLTFDRVLRTCAILAGENCSSEYPCVSNAICNSETQKCDCHSAEFGRSASGECRLNYGTDCSKSGNYCNADKFLSCNPEWSVCTCANDEEQIYHNVSGTCLARPSERCELIEYGISPPCVPNASCRLSEPNPQLEPQPTATADFGTCVCADGFESISKSFCLPLYGSLCDQDGCAPRRNLECSEFRGQSTCGCQSGTSYNESSESCQLSTSCTKDSLYDPNLNLCRIKAFRHCDPDLSDICVPDAVCENGICECTKYHQATGGQCELVLDLDTSRILPPTVNELLDVVQEVNGSKCPDTDRTVLRNGAIIYSFHISISVFSLLYTFL